jgi:hypothetical protein
VVEPLDDDPADESLLGLDMREVPGALILTVTGEIDVLTTPRLRAAVSKCLDRADELLVVDLTEVRSTTRSTTRWSDPPARAGRSAASYCAVRGLA